MPQAPLVVKPLTTSIVPEKPLGDLMREAQHTLVQYLSNALRNGGYDNIGAAHASVLAAVDPGGSRLATLVIRGGRTKQATAELTGHLVRRGYLELQPDPVDGRAKLYTSTSAGNELLQYCAEIVADYAGWLGRRVGPRGR